MRSLVALFFIGHCVSLCGAEHWPAPGWKDVDPAAVGMDEARLEAARDYALTGGGSGMILRHGSVVMRWGDQKQRYDLKSTTKSIGVTALGLAVADDKVRLDDLAIKHHPRLGVPPEENREAGWVEKITLRQLASQTAGFEKPGGFVPLLFEPGTQWHYSDSGPNWLAECLTFVYRKDMNELLFERIFSPIGIDRDDLVWRKHQYRPHQIEGISRREFGSGISANVEALSRIGYLYLRDGRWKDRVLLPMGFVEEATSTSSDVAKLPVHDPTNYGNASRHYGLLWWNNADGALPGVPRDAFWSWGLYDSLIVVMPSLDIVAVRAGKSWEREGDDHYAVLRPFLGPIARSVDDGDEEAQNSESAPTPDSPVIDSMKWAPPESIIRMAKGSDNWPITWGDDGQLYTAYGDGRGFEPFVEKKLSLGLARVEGSPESLRGENLRSTIEEPGDGRRGRKGSGLLMVDGVLYLWLRNADRKGAEGQLAWSEDRGRTWTEAEWRFGEFGYPTFVNFGRDYAGARDEFVYSVTPDGRSAYEPADRFILMRVLKDRIRDREAYEFFAGLTSDTPKWSKDATDRQAVFEHAGACLRSGISYCAGLDRYLWWQQIPNGGADTRSQGGIGIYDAPEPWGPWTTAYYAEQWDVGAGETGSFPTKWMSDDGRTLHLVFSGDDHFCVRKVQITLRAKNNIGK